MNKPTYKFTQQTKEGVLLFVVALPRSSRTEIVDIIQDRCKIKVKAPPVEGAANKALISIFSKLFKIAKSSVILKSGQTGKQKTFLFKGIVQSELETKILDIIQKRGKKL